jgi:hypothetical protein
MLVLDSFLTALSIVLIKFFFEREKYKERLPKLFYFLFVELAVFTFLVYFLSKLFS